VRRELARDWLGGLPWQKNVSSTNLQELRRPAAGDDAGLAGEARFALRVAAVAPRRRGRDRQLAERAPELIRVAAEEGWIHEDAWWLYQSERLDPLELDPVDEPDLNDEPKPRAATGLRDHEEEYRFWLEYIHDG